MNRNHFYVVLLIIIALLLASCKAPAPDSTTEADPYAVFTAAALTAEAKGGQINATSPATVAPSGTPVSTTPDDRATSPPRATHEAPSSGTQAAGEDQAEFVRDISIPDGTELPPNEPFVKTWLLKNTGSNTWTTDYNLVFIGGDQMQATESTPLLKAVPPNETVEVSVELIAPNSPATYTGYFNLQNANGDNFGVGVGSIEAFWVEIVVSKDAPPPATHTPDPSAEYVTQVFLYVDSTSANECPHTFNLTGNIILSNPATITYQLEAGASNPGFQIDLPDPVTAKMAAGTNTFEYKLTFTSAVNGWIILHITSPGDHYSNTVNITLNCQ